MDDNDMATALRDLLFLFRQPGEDSIGHFERVADRFYQERGMLAPGKSQAMELSRPTDSERRLAYDAWYENFQTRASKVLFAAGINPYVAPKPIKAKAL